MQRVHCAAKSIRSLQRTCLASTKCPVKFPWTSFIRCITIVIRTKSMYYILIFHIESNSLFNTRHAGRYHYFNRSRLELHTFSHWLNGDDFTGVSSSRRSDGHHPDAVLTVPAEVGDAVEKHVRGSFELAAHLRGKHFKLQEAVHNRSPREGTAELGMEAKTNRLGACAQTFTCTNVHASPTL